MEPEENTSDIVQGVTGGVKHYLKRIPVLGEIIAGYDAYKRSTHDRNTNNAIKYLQSQLDDLASFFSDGWIQSDEGEQFCRKVFDSAIDAQQEDKQKLFLNALINGIENKDTPYLEKMKFVDILRHLSHASIIVLAEMHKMCEGRVRRPGRTISSTVGIPQIDPVQIAKDLGSEYDPYLVTSAIDEMKSQGLFSTVGEWQKQTNGSPRAGAGFSTALAYTDFTCRFVEFITRPEEQSEQDKD